MEEIKMIKESLAKLLLKYSGDQIDEILIRKEKEAQDELPFGRDEEIEE